MKFLTSLCCAAALLFATIATADLLPNTNAAIAEIHVKSFEMWDDNGFGFTFGKYESGSEPCFYGPPPDYEILGCDKNGYFHVDWSQPLPLPDGRWGLTAWFMLSGPAVNEYGFPIAGTADDFVTVTLDLSPQPIAGTLDWLYRVETMTIDGSSLTFENTVNIDGLALDFSLEEDQVFGVGQLYFLPGFQGSILPADGPMGMMWNESFGIHYETDFDGGNAAAGRLETIPVPEPAFAFSLLAGVGLLAGLDRRRRTL